MRFLILLLLVLSACSHEEKRPEEKTEKVPVSLNPAPDAGASIETKQVAAESNAPFSTEIRFKKGASSLSKESKARLDKVLKQALKTGSVDEIEAYTWADQEYPGEKAKKLPPKAHDLAQARGEAIRSYFEKSGVKDKVKIITMTERPEGLTKTLKLGDTHEKETFAETGVGTTDSKKAATPKASRAAVMIILKK